MKASLDKKPTRSLTAADVCDRCSARAAVETVMMQGGSLLWCAHHFAFFEDALNAFGALVLSHLLGELWAGRGVPGWSALGFWLSVVVMVAVAGVLDVSFKRRNWLSRLLDVAEQEVDSAGR